MQIRCVAAEPDPPTAAAAVRTVFAAAAAAPRLPADADLRPVLPDTGGVPGAWVSAGGRHSAADGVLLYLHGGGFEHRIDELVAVLGHRFAAAAGRPAFAVHYRLAPAHPYPAAVDDVLAAYRSLLRHGVPAERVVILGESSGGTLALSAAQVLRDQGTSLPGGVVAVSAPTDLTLASPSIDANTNGDIGVDRALLSRLIGQYLGDTEPDGGPQSPLHGRLDGLPPLLLAAGAAEALRDDTVRFGHAAAAAGVPVTLDLYEAMPHAFEITVLDDANPTGRTFLRRLADWLAER